MASDDKLYDGYFAIREMDGWNHPSLLDSYTCSRAVNLSFRRYVPETRPAFNSIELEFSEDTDEEQFALGNIQGACAFRARWSWQKDGIAVAVGGSIFFLAISGKKAAVSRIYDGFNPKITLVHFCQAEDRLFVQNGENLPVMWDGITATELDWNARSEMPVGLAMVYAHGRVWVTTSTDQILASDIIFGSGYTSTIDLKNFTENEYWSEGGAFSLPTDMGKITGIGVARSQQTPDGVGEVIVFASNGALAIDGTVARENWADTQMQKVLMTGRGCIAPYSICDVCGDMWFRSLDGWSSLRMTMTEFAESADMRRRSANGNCWLEYETPHYRKYVSSAHFDRRILFGVHPVESVAEDAYSYGNHRYCKGMLVVDLDVGSMDDAQYRWDGLWTGIRPCQMVTMEVGEDGKRCFAFSHDADGENRLYELGKASGLDCGEKPVDWHIITKRFDWVGTEKSNSFKQKRLVAGEVWIADVKNPVVVQALCRPEGKGCFYRISPETQIGCTPCDEWDKWGPSSGMLPIIPQSAADCVGKPKDVATQFDFMLKGSGSCSVERMRFGVSSSSGIPSSPQDYRCGNVEDCGCGCVVPDDFGYLIVEKNGGY